MLFTIILVYFYKMTKKQKKYFLYQVYADVIVFSLLKCYNKIDLKELTVNYSKTVNFCGY